MSRDPSTGARAWDPPASSRWARQLHVGALRRLLRTHAGWLLTIVGGALLGAVLMDMGFLAIGLLMGVLLVGLSFRFPQHMTLFALMSAPLGSILTLRTPALNVRFTQSTWWLPLVGLAILWVFQRRRMVISQAFLAILAFGLYSFLSAAWSPDPRVAIRESFQFMTFVWIFFVFDNVLRSPRELGKGVKTFVVTSTVIVLGSLASHLAAPMLPLLRLSGGLRVQFVDGYFHDVTMATLAGAVSLVAAAVLFQGRRRTREAQVGWVVVLVASLVLQAVLAKRSELVAVFAAGLVLFALAGWSRVALFGALGALAAVVALMTSPRLLERFEMLSDPEEVKWHYAQPMAGWTLFKESPLIGHGYGSFAYLAGDVINEMGVFEFKIDPEEQRAAHNLIAETAAESGVVGLALFGGVVAVALLKMWRAARGPAPPDLVDTRALCRGLLAGALVGLIVSLGQNVYYWPPFWVVLALGYRAACIMEQALPAGSSGRASTPWARGRLELERRRARAQAA